jgi:hypothetical protein
MLYRGMDEACSNPTVNYGRNSDMCGENGYDRRNSNDPRTARDYEIQSAALAL